MLDCQKIGRRYTGHWIGSPVKWVPTGAYSGRKFVRRLATQTLTSSQIV